MLMNHRIQNSQILPINSFSELTEPDAVDDGILYADSPGEKVAMELARRERRRRKIVKELFETEKAYLNHLELIHKVCFRGRAFEN